MQLYYGVQATVFVIRNSEVVRYSGVSIVLYVWRLQLVHVTVSVIRPLLGVSANRESTVLCFLYGTSYVRHPRAAIDIALVCAIYSMCAI